MIVLLFLILLSACTYFTLNLSNKLSKEKQRIIFLTRQNNMLRCELNRTYVSPINIKIHYLPAIYYNGFTTDECSMHISPLSNSIILCNLKKNLNLTIHDYAELLGITWFEVSFKSDNNINNKGWVKSSYIRTSSCVVPAIEGEDEIKNKKY